MPVVLAVCPGSGGAAAEGHCSWHGGCEHSTGRMAVTGPGLALPRAVPCVCKTPVGFYLCVCSVSPQQVSGEEEAAAGPKQVYH